MRFNFKIAEKHGG